MLSSFTLSPQDYRDITPFFFWSFPFFPVLQKYYIALISFPMSILECRVKSWHASLLFYSVVQKYLSVLVFPLLYWSVEFSLSSSSFGCKVNSNLFSLYPSNLECEGTLQSYLIFPFIMWGVQILYSIIQCFFFNPEAQTYPMMLFILYKDYTINSFVILKPAKCYKVVGCVSIVLPHTVLLLLLYTVSLRLQSFDQMQLFSDQLHINN